MKKLTKVILSSAAVAALGCSMAFSLTACGGGETITITGSSSVTPIMQALAAEYEKDHDVRINVSQSDSGAGVKDTIDGNNDFGMASRLLKDSEISQGVRGETLCNDGLALVVGKNCPATNITTNEVYELYKNNTAACDGAITSAIGRGAGSGTRSYFDEHFGLEDGYHSAVGTQQETGNVIEALNGTTATIGYISYASLAANTNTIKALSLDGIACTLENILSGSYALQRPFVIVLSENRQLSEAAQGFYDFIMSDEAQAVITAEGCISIK